MDLELKPLDHFKLCNHLIQNFACGYSEDNRLFIINDCGLYILSLNGSIAFEFPSFAFKKIFISVSSYSPSLNVDLDINSFHAYIPKVNLYETNAKDEYTANLPNTRSIKDIPLCAEWSPRGLIAGSDCALAILTNLCSLEIYMKFIDENERLQYCSIINVTQAIINVEKSKWANAVKFSTSLKMGEFKKRSDSVASTAFTWSHLMTIGDRQACVIFVSVINGDITAWAIFAIDADPNVTVEPSFLGRYKTTLGMITTMYWHETDKYEGALIFANNEGKMNVIHVSNLDKEKAEFDSEQFLWTSPDKAIVGKITVMMHENKTFIMAAKEKILIVYGIDERGKFFDNTHVSTDHYITGIHHANNKIFLLSLTGTFTQILLSVENDTISFEEKVIYLKHNSVKYTTHGFFVSRNSVFFGVLAFPSELQSFSKAKAYVNVFLYQNSTLNPMELLLNNKSGNLEHYWDCFEVLRLVCLKENKFPWLDSLSDLNYDTVPLPKLKALMWIAKLSEMISKKVAVVKSNSLKPYIVLRYLVQIKLAVNRMKHLFDLLRSGKKLSVFQMRSIFLQNIFLKEMVVRDILPKANVGKTFVEDMISVMEIANELKYPEPMDCLWCGEKILGPSCLPPHVDSRCSMSMMPIAIIPTYKCPHCKAVAHKEMKNEHDVIFCVFCDVPMETIVQKLEPGELKAVKSECHKDCLNDSIDFDDIEENDIEYVIFSDSDDEDKGQCKELVKLYKKFSKASLEEIVNNGLQ